MAKAKVEIHQRPTALGAVGTKNPPIDADKVLYRDSTAGDALVTSTWTQIKAFLKTYWDTLYEALGSVATHAALTTGIHGITLAYPGESSVQALNLAAHVSRHQWLGADALNVKDLTLMQLIGTWYKQWTDTNGFTTSVSGTGAITTSLLYLILATGATESSKASVYSTYTFYVNYATAIRRFRFAMRISPRSTQTYQEMWIGLLQTPTAPTTTQNHIAFYINGSTLYASNADGTTQTITDTGITLVQNSNYDLYFKDMADNIKFYVNGVLVATHTTNRPAVQNLAALFYIVNAAAPDNAARTMWCYPFAAYQGAE